MNMFLKINLKHKYKSVFKWLTDFLEERQLTPEDELISAAFVQLMYTFLAMTLLVSLLELLLLIIRG